MSCAICFWNHVSDSVFCVESESNDEIGIRSQKGTFIVIMNLTGNSEGLIGFSLVPGIVPTVLQTVYKYRVQVYCTYSTSTSWKYQDPLLNFCHTKENKNKNLDSFPPFGRGFSPQGTFCCTCTCTVVSA